MRLCAVGIASVALACLGLGSFCPSCFGQAQPPSESLLIQSRSASSWQQGDVEVIALEGAVRIEVDQATLTARRSVIWLRSAGSGPHAVQRAEIVLMDDAEVQQKLATRNGRRLLVTADVRGTIRLTTDDRSERDRSDSVLFREAETFRHSVLAPPAPAVVPEAPPDPAPTNAPVPPSEPLRPAPMPALSGPVPTQSASPPANPLSSLPSSQPGVLPYLPQPTDYTPKTGVEVNASPPATRPTKQIVPVYFEAKNLETIPSSNGKVAAVLTGDVMLFQRRPNGDTIELRAERAVLFTAVRSLKELGASDRSRQLQDSVLAAYLEGDVRVIFTPQNYKIGEQRLGANRVYYEFATDRAVLTDAVIHTVDPTRQIPFVVRARTVHQLALGEFTADKAQLTTSTFAVPSYAINSDHLYVRSDEVPGPTGGEQIYYRADRDTFQVFGQSVFFYPSMSGTVSDQGGALRDIGGGNRNVFGVEAFSEWGLFESLGMLPPPDLDAAFRLDYFSERGPGIGLNGAYGGRLGADTYQVPSDFEGDFKSYLVYDTGEDELGGVRRPAHVGEENLRGRFSWEHQQFFPDDWQVQLRAGYVSDATFREEFFLREFQQDLPLDTSIYVKHQQQSEAFTLLAQADLSHVVTTSDLEQEQFEVEHLPEIGYRRIGDSFLEDHLTFFSDNTFDGLHYQRSRTSLLSQGYAPQYGLLPGQPSLGLTGITGQTVFRENFREEVDYPITAGAYRITPYLVGIFTSYSDSPGGGGKNRVLFGAGSRFTTEFWKTDPNAESEIFDIHQLRHVIEPELNLFTSVQNIKPNDVYIYDETVDATNAISSASLAVHQRWQTKRGGPGQWRSVDALTFNAEIVGFLDKPRGVFIEPRNFRGLFLPSLPETSIPRDAINTDASWRISDTTLVVADTSYNLDKRELATAGIGLLVRRGDGIDYYIENRYVGLLGSNITSFHIDYQLSSKYSIAFDQAFDFSFGKNVNSGISVARRFDTFVATVSVFEDVATGQSGFNFSIQPVGLKQGLGSGAFSNSFNR